jgi:hypothetical protein
MNGLSGFADGTCGAPFIDIAGDPGRSAIATDSNDLAGPACANIRIEPLSDFRRWSSIELKEAGFQRGGEGSVEKVWQWCRPTIGGKPTKLTL